VMSADHASVIRYFGAGRTIVQARVEGVQARGLG
jgi:hypothetical protein